jgi:hypothetical protein
MNFLIFKKAIPPQTYETALAILKKKAYYGAFVYEYGRRVYAGLTSI